MPKTTYDVILTDGTGAGTRARKDAAIKLGELQEQPFKIVSQPSGTVVYTSGVPQPFDIGADTETTEAPAPAPTKKEKTVAKKTTKTETAPEAEATEERTGTELEFQGLGKYYARAAGLHGAEVIGAVFGVEAELKGTTLTLFGADEDVEQVSEHLLALWPQAKLAHRDYRKTDKVYSEISKDRKDKEANAQRWDLEVKWFMTFMDGAADALADTVKKKGGAYKAGVNAVLDPATPADDDVI